MSRVDWQAIRARLEAASAALARGGAPGAEERRRVLQARARALAEAPRDGRPAQDELEVVEFLVAEERYAVESRFVRAVHPLKALTALPGTPPHVLGVAKLRGPIVSVIDLKKLFDLPGRGLSDLDRVLVIGNDAMEFGVLADRIAGVRRIAAAELQPSLPTLAGVREQYLKGVSADRLVVLDAQRLLNDARLVVREEPQN